MPSVLRIPATQCTRTGDDGGKQKIGEGFFRIALSALLAYGELERCQITLQTVKKSTEKPAETPTWAKQFTATTLFGLRDAIGAAVVFRNMGLSAQRWLRVAGDVAVAIGVNIPYAFYAVALAAASGAEKD